MSLVNFILVLNSNTVTVEEPPVLVAPSITNTYKTISNKYVDITFDVGVYINDQGESPVTTANFSIVDFVAGGVTNIAIASVKINNHYISASATDLIGGDYTVRIFLTLTGTPDGTESFRIRCTNIYSAEGGVATLNSDTLNINITPLIVWDYLETASVVTDGLGISEFNDVMGVANLTQSTDADRPLDADGVVYFDRDNTEYFNGGDVGALDFQKASSFTVVLKKFRVLNSGTSAYVVANRANSPGNNGWAIQTGAADGSLFFVMHDGTTQATTDYDAFNGSAERDVMFFVNNAGTLTVYDSAGTQLGTSVSTSALSTISYTSVNMSVGRRLVVTTNDMEGYFEKMIIVNSALTAPQRALYVANL